MAITKSAKKAIRGSERKRVFNVRRKRATHDVTKKIEKLIAEGNVTEAEKLIPNAYKVIDKSTKMKTLKKNTASRKKARLVASIARAKKTAK